MAAELEKRLEAEKPRNHLDMRHRLDPNGKRWGPVIEYKISELRMTELMDDLCEEEMDQYTLWPRPDQPVLKPGKPVGIEPGWLRYKGEGHHKEARKVARGGGVKGKQEQNHLKLQLKTYCARGRAERHRPHIHTQPASSFWLGRRADDGRLATALDAGDPAGAGGDAEKATGTIKPPPAEEEAPAPAPEPAEDGGGGELLSFCWPPPRC